MSGTRESQILAAIDMLVTWPDTGQPDELVSPKTVAFAEAIGWIERIAVKEWCSHCGQSRLTGRGFLITSAGRAALELHRIHTGRLAYAEGKAEGYKSVAEQERADALEREALELRTGFTEDDFA